MGQIIAFDSHTASALAVRTGTAAQLGHGSPLKAALANNAAMLLVPTPAQDRVLAVRVNRRVRAATKSVVAPHNDNWAPDMIPVSYEATGLLGLEDAPIYARDLEPQPKKKWWQKILE
jgi:hypothetical protein